MAEVHGQRSCSVTLEINPPVGNLHFLQSECVYRKPGLPDCVQQAVHLQDEQFITSETLKKSISCVLWKRPQLTNIWSGVDHDLN